MSKASEDKLNELHGTVSRVLATRLTAPLRTAEGEEIPGTEGLLCSAADITAAIAFLKNNGVTADPSEDQDLKSLNEKLAERRLKAKQRISDAAKEAAAEELERNLGLQLGGSLQ